MRYTMMKRRRRLNQTENGDTTLTSLLGASFTLAIIFLILAINFGTLSEKKIEEVKIEDKKQ